MRQLTPFVASTAALIAATSVTVLGGGSGAALADGTSVLPLSSILRGCDSHSIPYMPSQTTGTGFAIVGRTGNTVTAEVHMTGVIPDIWYGVRLVEVPRPGTRCGPGAPGVGFGQLYTDDAGNGFVTVQAPVMQGATGAWVSVDGPLGYSKDMSGDFRTSDYAASI